MLIEQIIEFGLKGPGALGSLAEHILLQLINF